jgi:hypothetical protein
VVETSAAYAIERAQGIQENADNLTWGMYIKSAIENKPLFT